MQEDPLGSPSLSLCSHPSLGPFPEQMSRNPGQGTPKEPAPGLSWRCCINHCTLCLQTQLGCESPWQLLNQGILSAWHLHSWPLETGGCQAPSELENTGIGTGKVRKMSCWLIVHARRSYHCPGGDNPAATCPQGNPRDVLGRVCDTEEGPEGSQPAPPNHTRTN